MGKGALVSKIKAITEQHGKGSLLGILMAGGVVVGGAQIKDVKDGFCGIDDIISAQKQTTDAFALSVSTQVERASKCEDRLERAAVMLSKKCR